IQEAAGDEASSLARSRDRQARGRDPDFPRGNRDPRYRGREAEPGRGDCRGQGQDPRVRRCASARCEGGRRGAVRQVLGQRGQGRRRGGRRPARRRHSRGVREIASLGFQSEEAVMAAKQLVFAQQAREEMLKGVNVLANAVKETLGPKGRNVLIEKSWGAPTVTKDGVTVAKEIQLEQKFQNIGAQMVKEVASKTSDTAGDGTTTATVLAQAIFREGLKAASAGMDPMDLKRGIDKAAAAAV